MAGITSAQKTERPRGSASAQNWRGVQYEHPTRLWLLGLLFVSACGDGFTSAKFTDAVRQAADAGSERVVELAQGDDAGPLDAATGGSPSTGGTTDASGGESSSGGTQEATGGVRATGGTTDASGGTKGASGGTIGASGGTMAVSGGTSDAGEPACVPVIIAAGLYCCCHPPDRSEACACKGSK